MTTYEIMCVFAPQDELFTEGLSAVKKVLSTLNANIEKEEDMGVRKIAGEIKKHTHAHYLYFIAKLDPKDAHSIRKEVSLIAPLLRILVIKKELVLKKK